MIIFLLKGLIIFKKIILILNHANNETCIVKINNHRDHALKSNKNKYNQLKELLNQFTHKELSDFILNKVSY